ncbi:MAG: tetratricopeptide repeat protein, partial [Candidatus Hodarchaeota archaeon]
MQRKDAKNGTAALYISESSEAISSLEQIIQESVGKARVDALNELSRISWKLGILDRSVALAEEAIQNARENDYTLGIAYSLSNLSDCHRLRGNIDRALAYAKESLEISQQVQSAPHVAYALNDIADVYRVRGDLPLALEHYNKALTIREKLNDIPGQVRSLNTLSEVFIEIGDFPSSEKHCKNALALSKEHKYSVGIGYSKNNLADLFLLQGRLDEALNLYEESLELRKKLNDRNGEVRSLNNLTQAFLLKGDLERAQKLALTSLRMSEHIGNRYSQAVAYQNLGDILRVKGEKRALRSYEKSYRLKEELGHQSGLSPINCAFSEIHRVHGDLDKARGYAEEALKLAKRTGSQRFIAQAFNELALTRFVEGDVSGAKELLKQCISISSAIGDQPSLATFQTHLGEVLSALGDLTSAHQLFHEALEIMRNTGYVKEIAKILCALGNLHSIQGAYEKSVTDVRKAIDMQLNFGFELDAAHSMLTLAKIQRNSGFLAEADNLYSKAEAICQRLDDTSGLLVAIKGKGRVLTIRGEISEAFSSYKKAFRLVANWEEQIACLIAEGELQLLVGEVSKARKAFEQVKSSSTKVGSALDAALADIRLAEVDLLSGGPENEIINRIEPVLQFLKESSVKGSLLFSGLLVKLHAVQEKSNSVPHELEIIGELKELAEMHQSDLDKALVQLEFGDAHLARSNFGIARTAYYQALQLAKKARSAPSEFTARLRLAELSVRDYGDSFDEDDYQAAYDGLISVSKEASERKIMPLFIDSLILRSFLASSAMQYPLALSLSQKAYKLSESHKLKQQMNRAKNL